MQPNHFPGNVRGVRCLVVGESSKRNALQQVLRRFLKLLTGSVRKALFEHHWLGLFGSQRTSELVRNKAVLFHFFHLGKRTGA